SAAPPPIPRQPPSSRIRSGSEQEAWRRGEEELHHEDTKTSGCAPRARIILLSWPRTLRVRRILRGEVSSPFLHVSTPPVHFRFAQTKRAAPCGTALSLLDPARGLGGAEDFLEALGGLLLVDLLDGREL